MSNEKQRLFQPGNRPELPAERVGRHRGEYFDFIRREWTPKSEINSREVAARERMNKLFGD
jgi:hypothetical protein